MRPQRMPNLVIVNDLQPAAAPVAEDICDILKNLWEIPPKWKALNKTLNQEETTCFQACDEDEWREDYYHSIKL